MRLLNFSTGRIRTVEIGGEAVQTAHLKEPVAEPWVISEDGARGDQRAVHPDKLYAFARTGYAHWAEHFGVAPGDWADGFFGENLTLDELDETDIRVGDEFTLGDTVRVVAAGARTPCVKLAWRLGQPRTFQKVFAESRHTGMYLAVLQPGQVRPGDRLQRVRHDPDMPSIADVCDFIGGTEPPPLAPLQRLLAAEHLSPANRMLLSAKLHAAEMAAEQREAAWPGWRDFVIARVIDEAVDIKSFYLRPADGEALPVPRPGQHVVVRLNVSGEKPLLRTWSLSDFGYAMEEYRITVKQHEGPGSRFLHSLQAGDTVELRAPAGRFVLDAGSFRPIVLVAAGIGITPLLAMLRAQLARPDAPPVHLIYGARNAAAVAFRDELDELARNHAGLKITYIYSRESQRDRPARRIDLPLVIEELGELHVTLGGHDVPVPWYEADIYLCGPDAFCDELREAVVARGGNGDRVFSETFRAAADVAGLPREAQVSFLRSGVTTVWRVDEGLTLLELAEQNAVVTESDCRAGSCLTCRVPLTDGSTTAELGDGTTLLCIARPRSERVELEC